MSSSKKNRVFYRFISCLVGVTFVFTTIIPPSQAQTLPELLNLPIPGTKLSLSNSFDLPLIKGIVIYPEDQLRFDFLIDRGDEKMNDADKKEAYRKIIKYFLASITIPEDDLWVNLSPYEKDRIIPDGFGKTEMGRDLLMQDYMLKQLSASLMHPEDELGQKFWNRVKQKAKAKFGTSEIPLNTFNKIWIVPQKAKIYEHENVAYLVDSHLKVMLEEDYLALAKDRSMKKEEGSEGALPTSDSHLPSQIIKEILIPEIEREVNEGKTFANLRQIYHAQIFAVWFKMVLKESLLGQVYASQNKTKGVHQDDPATNQKIYEQYLEAFKKGVFDYIKEDYDPATQQIVPKKYFSGGAEPVRAEDIERTRQLSRAEGEGVEADAVNLDRAAVQTAEVGAGAIDPVNAVTQAEKDTGKFAALGKDKEMTGEQAVVEARAKVVSDEDQATNNARLTRLRKVNPALNQLIDVQLRGRNIRFTSGLRGHALTDGNTIWVNENLIRSRSQDEESTAKLIEAALVNETQHDAELGDPQSEFLEEIRGLRLEARVLADFMAADLGNKERLMEVLRQIHQDLIRTVTDQLLDRAADIANDVSGREAGRFIIGFYPEHAMNLLMGKIDSSNLGDDIRNLAGKGARFGALVDSSPETPPAAPIVPEVLLAAKARVRQGFETTNRTLQAKRDRDFDLDPDARFDPPLTQADLEALVSADLRDNSVSAFYVEPNKVTAIFAVPWDNIADGSVDPTTTFASEDALWQRVLPFYEALRQRNPNARIWPVEADRDYASSYSYFIVALDALPAAIPPSGDGALTPPAAPGAETQAYAQVKQFGAGKAFSVAEFAARNNVSEAQAREDLDRLWLESENVEKVRDINGAELYRYAPVTIAVQLGPDANPEDVPMAGTVVINHSETKEFLGVKAQGAAAQLRRFLRAGFKVVLPFGDFPARLGETDYVTKGLRNFPTNVAEIAQKLESDISPDLAFLLGSFAMKAADIQTATTLNDLRALYPAMLSPLGVADDATEVTDIEDLKRRMIAELSTQFEIEYEISILFKGLTAEEMKQIIPAYEPIEGIKGTVISQDLAGYRQRYIRAAIERAVAPSVDPSSISILYGGGGNVKNIASWPAVGYRGAFIGRASALAEAEAGKDSTSNISEAAAASPTKLVTIYNAKSFDAKSIPDHLKGYEGKGLDVENKVKIIHAVSRLDYLASTLATTEDGKELAQAQLADRSDVQLPVDITINAGLGIGTQGIGAFTAHHPAELLKRAGVRAVVINPNENDWQTKVRNLGAQGIKSLMPIDVLVGLNREGTLPEDLRPFVVPYYLHSSREAYGEGDVDTILKDISATTLEGDYYILVAGLNPSEAAELSQRLRGISKFEERVAILTDIRDVRDLHQTLTVNEESTLRGRVAHLYQEKRALEKSIGLAISQEEVPGDRAETVANIREELRKKIAELETAEGQWMAIQAALVQDEVPQVEAEEDLQLPEGLTLRDKSLARFIYVKNSTDETRVENPEGAVRTIKFENGLFTLVSRYSRATGTTSHEFSGYGITPILMMRAQAGDETVRNWQSILVELEDGVGPNGIPYRDGIMQGNSYNQRMLPEEVAAQIASYAGRPRERREFSEYDQASAFAADRRASTTVARPIEVINTGTQLTFGMAMVVENGQEKVVIESAFLDMIEAKGNPYNMLTRSFVYLLNQGTHEENRIAEYEYAKFLDSEVNKKIRVDVEKVYDNIVTQNVRPHPDKPMSEYDVTREWARKTKESLWEIGVHMMNGDLELSRVRWSEQDPEFAPDEETGDVTIGLYASALNPLHFGQFEPVLRAMAQLKIAQVGVVNHAFDYRKLGKGLNPTYKSRVRMAKNWMALFEGLLVYSEVLEGSEADGETKYEELMRLNAERKGTTTCVYTAVGGDHMHMFAPSDKMKDGYRIPRIDRDAAGVERPQPDTVTKMLRIKEGVGSRIRMILAFNFRELFDSLPMPFEVGRLVELMKEGFVHALGHINLFDTSSTNVRDYYSGDDSSDISFLPASVAKEIEEDGEYRGWVIGLPKIIKRIAAGEGSEQDVAMLKKWLADERRLNHDVSAQRLSNDFSFTEEQLRNDFKFIAGSLEESERRAQASFRRDKDGNTDLIEVTVEEAARAIAIAEPPSGGSAPDGMPPFAPGGEGVDPAAPGGTTAAPEVQSRSLAGITVILADDVQGPLDATAVELERRGGRVIRVTTAEAVLDELSRLSASGAALPEVISADNSFDMSGPGGTLSPDHDKLLSGPQLFAAIRERFPGYSPKFVFRSGVIAPGALLDDAQQSAPDLDAYIGKTTKETDEFPDLIERLVGRASTAPSSDLSTVSVGPGPLGGINLDPKLLDLQIKRDGNGVPLPLNLQPLMNMKIEGFVPIILNIAPVGNLPLLLGMRDEDSDSDLGLEPGYKAREVEDVSSLN